MPQGGNKSNTRWSAGKKSIARAFAITEAVPETICYAAVLVCHHQTCVAMLISPRQTRFGMDTQSEWCEQDGEFVYESFFNNLMAMFEDEEWAKGTLEWYNV